MIGLNLCLNLKNTVYVPYALERERSFSMTENYSFSLSRLDTFKPSGQGTR